MFHSKKLKVPPKSKWNLIGAELDFVLSCEDLTDLQHLLSCIRSGGGGVEDYHYT